MTNIDRIMASTVDKIPKFMVFPCERIPSEPREARLLGLYRQNQEGFWMQRIKILGGILKSRQWRGLAEIARQYTVKQHFHLTTRQDIEIHDLTAEQVPAVQRALADMQLTSVGACGDTLRNITVCSCSGVLAGTVDLLALAWAIRRDLEGLKEIYSLPRKFKISLSCGRKDCSNQPWINDLSFIAERRYGVWGLKVLAAGSLGTRPKTAIKLFDRIPVEFVPACARAAVRIFDQYGNRQNRNRARLRHVRERLGDLKFTTLISESLEKAKQETIPETITLQENNQRFTDVIRLNFTNGNVSVEAAEALASLAEREEFVLRIANQHQVWVFGRDAMQLQETINDFPALQDAAQPQLTIVACPGKRSCRRALTDTNELANRIRREFSREEFHGLTVCISGCPNSCSHSAVAPIGLVGVLTKRQGQRQQAYNLFFGGGMGRNEVLALHRASQLSSEEVIEAIRKIRQNNEMP